VATCTVVVGSQFGVGGVVVGAVPATKRPGVYTISSRDHGADVASHRPTTVAGRNLVFEDEVAAIATAVAETATDVAGEAVRMIPPGGFETWLVHTIESLGPHAEILTFIGAILENTALVSVALPGGIAVVVAAAAGRADDASLLLMIVLATIGTIIGAAFDWTLGRMGVARVLAHPATGRLGRYLLKKLSDAEPAMAHHGWWLMLIMHVVGQGRTAFAVAAGTSGMPLRRFLQIEAPAAFVWSLIYVSGGYWLGGRMQHVAQVMVRWGWTFVAGMILVVGVVWLVRRWFSPKSSSHGESNGGPMRSLRPT
jgi:membrane-associated protein